MSQRRTHEESEAQKAWRLEQLHEQLQSPSDDPDLLSDVDSQELAEAVGVLRMIERARRFSGGSSTAPMDAANASYDTPIDPLTSTSPGEPSWLDNLPSKMGHFEILELLGHGGHGLVLLADDIELKRKVALKLPRPEALLDPYLKRRFVLEAEVAASLSHPNIVPVYEAGSVGPFCYIAYAYCKGESLSHWLERQDEPVHPRLAARIVEVLAAAIHQAHSRGIVHRDLKPGNVLLADIDPNATEFDPRRSCRITDFGLAKLESTDQNLTRSGAIVGTTAYLAPEQAEGGLMAVGPPADLFALGTMLYELLTGRTPFRRETSLDTLSAIRSAEPVPPRHGNAQIPRDLEAICLKCLEKSPSARYASAAELAVDLGRFLDGQPVQARPVSSLARLLRWCRRNPLIATLSAVALALLLVGTSAVAMQWLRAEQNLFTAKTEFARAEENLDIARKQGIRASKHLRTAQEAIDELLNQLAKETGYIPQMQQTQRRLLVSALNFQRRLLADESDDPLVQLEAAEGYLRVARINQVLGDLSEAEKACDIALRLCEKVATQLAAADDEQIQRFLELYPDVNTLFAQAYRSRAQVFQNRQSLGEARADYEEAVRYARKNIESNANVGPMRAELANDLRNLAIIASQIGQVETANELFPLAVAELNHVQDSFIESPDFRFIKAKCLNSLAIHLRSKGEYPGAAQRYMEAAELLKDLVEEIPHDAEFRRTLAETNYNRGNFYLTSLRKPDEAGIFYLAAIEDFGQLAKDYPAAPIFRERLGRANFAEGLYFKSVGEAHSAERSYLQSIEIAQDLADDFPDVAEYRALAAKGQSNLSTLYMDLDRWEEAQDVLDQSMTIRKSLVESYPEDLSYRTGLATSLVNLASVLAKRQRYDEAAALFRAAIGHQRKVVEADPQTVQYRRYLAQDIEFLAKALLMQGDYSQASDTVASLPELSLDEPGYSLMAAAFYARSLETIAEDSRLSEEQSTQRLAEYRDRVFEMIDLARVAGLDDASKLTRKDFDGVRDDPRFAALVRELSGQ